jgi:hypothetical protein
MAAKKIVFDEKTIQVADLLTQIAQLNEMINLHQMRQDAIGQQTCLQYQDLRRTFLNKLNQALINFDITAHFLGQAA